MLLLDFSSRPPSTPILVGETVTLRRADQSDFEAWTALREQSRQSLIAWEPDWRAEDMTVSAFRHRIRMQWRDIRRGTGLPLLICRTSDNALLGGMSLSNIRMGAARSAVVGYWIGSPYARRGYASAGLTALLYHAFEALGLNRVEAACQPSNQASVSLLESKGFVREGLARSYLNINGAWRDHYLYAITALDHSERRAR